MFLFLFIHLFIYLFIYLLFIHFFLFIYLFIFVYLFIYFKGSLCIGQNYPDLIRNSNPQKTTKTDCMVVTNLKLK